MTMGTYEYTAPEQARDAAGADIRADIYSLGCTLYYFIAGVLPFDYPSDAKLLLAHQNEIPRPLCEICPETPQELSDLVDRMLAKDPDDRPRTPADVARALLPFAKGENAGQAAEGQAVAQVAKAPAASPGLTVTQWPATRKEGARLWQRCLSAIPPRLRFPAMLLTASGAAFVGALLLGVLFTMRTREGTLVVKISDPEATIRVLDAEGKLLIEQKAGAEKVEISVVPGKGTLRVVKNGVELFAKEFSLVSRGRETINAEWKPGPAPMPKPPPAIVPFDAKKAEEHQQAEAERLGLPMEITNSIGMQLLFCPPGSFTMGSPANETDRSMNEEQMPVRISRGFYLGKYSVTQAEFRSVMGASPWAGKSWIKEGDDYTACGEQCHKVT